MAQAISEGIAQEMERDPKVFVMGEDIGIYGGIFGATGGLLAKFGDRAHHGYADLRDRLHRHRHRRRRRRACGRSSS